MAQAEGLRVTNQMIADSPLITVRLIFSQMTHADTLRCKTFFLVNPSHATNILSTTRIPLFRLLIMYFIWFACDPSSCWRYVYFGKRNLVFFLILFPLNFSPWTNYWFVLFTAGSGSTFGCVEAEWEGDSGEKTKRKPSPSIPFVVPLYVKHIFSF